MTVRKVYRRFIAVAQQGRGFNYNVEAAFTASEFVAGRVRMDEVLEQIDHKSLGLDLDLGFEPTSERLVSWIAEQIGTALEVRLVRGDGVSFYAQPRGIG